MCSLRSMHYFLNGKIKKIPRKNITSFSLPPPLLGEQYWFFPFLLSLPWLLEYFKTTIRFKCGLIWTTQKRVTSVEDVNPLNRWMQATSKNERRQTSSVSSLVIGCYMLTVACRLLVQKARRKLYYMLELSKNDAFSNALHQLIPFPGLRAQILSFLPRSTPLPHPVLIRLKF